MNFTFDQFNVRSVHDVDTTTIIHTARHYIHDGLLRAWASVWLRLLWNIIKLKQKQKTMTNGRVATERETVAKPGFGVICVPFLQTQIPLKHLCSTRARPQKHDALALPAAYFIMCVISMNWWRKLFAIIVRGCGLSWELIMNLEEPLVCIVLIETEMNRVVVGAKRTGR